MLWLEHIPAEQRRIRLGSPVAYLIAALLVLLAWVVRLVLGEELVGVPFITFFPVVVLSALVGGFGPGLLATILGAICAWVTLIPPRESLAIKSVSDALALILFFLTSILMCAVIHAFHVAISNIREARQREREFSAALEQRVAERTEELRVAYERAVAEMLNREKAEMIAQQSQKLRLIGQLTGGIAHDFNNLLTIIIGNLDTAQRRLASGDTEKVERLIGSAIRGGERAAVLTHRLLAFARQQALSPGTEKKKKIKRKKKQKKNKKKKGD